MRLFEVYLLLFFILIVSSVFLIYLFSEIKVLRKKSKASKNIGKDFIYFIVHQLSMPLSSIKLSLEMLLDGSFGEINKEQRDVIEKIHQRNKMLIYLVQDLLNVAKIEEGKYSYNKRLVDVEDLIRFIITSSQEEIKRKKIKFKFEKPEIKFPKITLDIDKICLVIQNIVDNAVRYTPVGGEIIISLKIDEKELEFKIKDSGIGIPEYQKEKIFTKFFRGDNAIKKESIGFGLGLFIAKNIIEEHNGKIWFESKEGQGSTFFFTIPIKYANGLRQL